MVRFTYLTAVLLLLMLGACETHVEPEPTPAGSLSFQYSGALSGTFEVNGAYPGPGIEPATFAAARLGVQEGVLGLGGFRARGEAQDGLSLDLRGATRPGIYAPATGSFTYGVVNRDFAGASTYDLVTGEVVITSIDAGQVRGTFSGTFEEVVSPFSAEADTMHVTNGRFDLPILEGW